MMKLKMILAAVALAIISVGCASDGRPHWARRGSGVYADADDLYITGVGMATANPNVAFRNQAALLRARQELQRQIIGYVPSVVAEFGEFCRQYWGDAKSINTQTGGFIQMKKAVAIGVTEEAMRYAVADLRWEAPDGSLFVGLSVPMRTIRILIARHVLLPQNRGMMGERFADENEIRRIVDAYFEKSSSIRGISNAAIEEGQ